MWPPKLSEWTVSADYVANACLRDWQFCMNKRGRDGFARASIAPVPGQRVWGVLYQVGAEALEKLDVMEGLGRGYRADFLPVEVGQSIYQAYTYIGIKLAEGLPVTDRYRDMILHGARHYALPVDYITWLQHQFVVEA